MPSWFSNAMSLHEHEGAMAQLAMALGYPNLDLALLSQAVTHRSYAHENGERAEPDNERLEFLGDTVLGMIVAEYLFGRYPHEPEGQLAKKKSILVSEPTLARVARRFQLPLYLRLGKGEELSGGRERASLLADAMEAIIGAIYLSQGYTATRRFILSWLEEEVVQLEKRQMIADPKTALQELTQALAQERPTYRVIKEEGPDHRKEFQVEVLFGGERLGLGRGRTKKAAQKAAAMEALVRLQKRLGLPTSDQIDHLPQEK